MIKKTKLIHIYWSIINNAVSIQDKSFIFVKKNFRNILCEWRDYVMKMGKLVSKEVQDTHPNP